MIRFLHALAITGLIASAAYAYSVKYETLYYAEEVQRQKAKLAREHDAIAVAKAEWALLTRPDRLQRMVEQHLDLQPMNIGQLARLSDIPNRVQRGDEIARMLGDPSSLPKEARAPDARPKGPVAFPPKEDAIARLLGAPAAAAKDKRLAEPRTAEPRTTGSIAPLPKTDAIARLLGLAPVPKSSPRPAPAAAEWDPRAR